MRMYDIIKKKRDGNILEKKEINYFVENYTKNKIPDYQMSALLMAIYLKKLNHRETLNLTKSMVSSGDVFDLSSIKGTKVDKHSTGGVGDTTTLILGPMVAACGLPFAKMSGRGLGHTGGTLDKLESIKGFRIALSNEEFVNNVNKINISICSQTGNIAPADRKLYALRDVTATVDDLSLIASSIMSKKLAVKSDAIILDVKVGSGAFMKNIEDAISLAEEMVNIGHGYGRKTMAVVTNMDEPLGNAIGNSLEMKEAIDTLKGKGPKDLFELCLILGSKLLILSNKAINEYEARKILLDVVDSGKAYKKLLEMVESQGGDLSYIENPDLFLKSEYVLEVKSNKKGYVSSINAEEIGKLALSLGAGRETMDSKIDLSVGIILNKKVGNKVEKGEILGYVHLNKNKIKEAKIIEDKLRDIIFIGKDKIKAKPLIYKVIEKNNDI